MTDKGIYGYHNQRRKTRQEAMSPQEKAAARTAAKLKLLVPVECAPVVGDPEAVDWGCGCGYEPQTDRVTGKVLPQTREPAWQWSEEPRGRKKCMRTHITAMMLQVYGGGLRHSTIELHDGEGFPDFLFWGRNGLIVRELKAMRHTWRRGQKQHLLSMREAGIDAGVYYPCCILSGLVDEDLARLTGRKATGPYARAHRGVPNRSNYSWQEIADGALNPDG